MISVQDISLFDQLKATSDIQEGGRAFWPAFSLKMKAFLQASDFFVFIQQGDQLRRIQDGTDNTPPDEQWMTLTRAALGENKPVVQKTPALRVAQKMAVTGERSELIIVAGWSDNDPALEAERLFRFRVGSHIPDLFQKNRTQEQSREDVVRLAYILEVVASLQDKQTFAEAALSCCNLLAGQMRSERVALGWLENGHLVLRGVNQQPDIVRDSTFSRQLEQMMLEAVTFNAQVSLEKGQGRSDYPVCQEYLDSKDNLTALAVIPMHKDGEVAGAIFLEREQGVFAETELWQLRLYADHLSFQFANLYHTLKPVSQKIKDRWHRFYHRAWREKSPLDLTVMASLVLVPVILLSLSWTYHIEARFILKTDTLKVVSSPFDGFLSASDYRTGDQVQSGDVIARLDTRELLLEQSAAVADLQRQKREADKARATGALAEMRIAQAQVEQAQSRLDMIAFRIRSSEIKAPFDSILVEGNIEQLSGSPVRQGEILLKLASLQDFYFELEAQERVIQDLTAGMTAQVSFVTRPEEKFQVGIEKIIPVAQFRDGENVFRIRARFQDAPPQWWRPGMSGLAHVDAGERSGFWLVFHNLIDTLRMKLWW